MRSKHGAFYIVLEDVDGNRLTSSFPSLPTISKIQERLDDFPASSLGKVIISFRGAEEIASFEWAGITLPEAKEIRKKFLALREISD